MITDTVLRWDDGYQPATLAEQLRTRPGYWAITDENLPDMALRVRVDGLRGRLGEGFEVEAFPCDDGPYGVLYEIRARYHADSCCRDDES